MGVRIARKHVAWYLAMRPDARAHRQLFNLLELPGEQLHYINEIPTLPINEVLAA